MLVETLKRKVSFDSDGQPGKRQHIQDASSEVTGTRKLPTAAEVDEIATSSSLYRSPQFHGLLNSLLDDVAPPESLLPPVEAVLHELHPYLTTLPPFPPSHPLEAAAKLEKKGVKITWASPAPTSSTQYKVGFEPPTASGIYLVGSFAGVNKTLVRSRNGTFCIDMAVEVPPNLLQEKDYLNSRVFHVRSFYLAYIGSKLSGKKSPLKSKLAVQFDTPTGDPRQTCLVLTPINGTFDSSFSIRLIASLPQISPIPLHRLSPTHCSIRPAETSHIPTPHYSASLALLTLPKTLLLLNHTLSTQVSSFKDTIRLLKVWGAQRCYAAAAATQESLSTSGWGVLGFESGRSLFWSCLIAALVLGEEISVQKSKGKGKLKPVLQIGRGLSSYQLFRAVMDLLATRDFVANHLFVKSTIESSSPPFPQEHWKDFEGPVFVEPSGRCNVLDGVSNGALELIAIDARRTLDTLNRPTTASNPDVDVEVFQEVFTRDLREPNDRFDLYFEIDLSKVKVPPNIIGLQDAGSERSYILANIYKTLSRGLTDRVHALTLLSPSTDPYPTTSFPPALSPKVGLGVILNPAESYRLVDRGPMATAMDDQAPSEELSAFNTLWGPKSELRRFKDGAIHQSVVWDQPSGMQSLTSRERIPGRIIQYLLNLHFGIASEDIREVFAHLDEVICFDKKAERDLGAASSLDFAAAQKSYDDLVKTLKSISSTSDVPLSLTSVQAASPHLRHTSIFPAYPATSVDSYQSWSPDVPYHARFIPPLPIVLHFEKSSSWPDDIVAIQSVKLALLEALARSLMAKGDWNGAARVVTSSTAGYTELEEWGGADKARLEVITPEGFAFEGRIYHNREAVLLKRIIEPPKIANPLSPPPATPHERHLASIALHQHLQRYIHEPMHHAAILTLHHRHPTFSHTIRLVKRFLNSQLLGASLHDSAIELLVSASFFKNYSGSAKNTRSGNHLPATGIRGFVSFLRFLSEWDWRRGVDVPIYAIAKAEAPSDEPSTFQSPELENVEAADLIATGAVYRLRTANDPQGIAFTSPASSTPCPSPVIARRITTIARSAYMHIVSHVSAPDHKLLFTPSTAHYDFIIHIEPSALHRGRENIQQSLRSSDEYYRNLNIEPNAPEEPLRVGFDPAYMFFQDIQRAYADTALLLTDPQYPVIIGGVWNPSLKEARRWRVMSGYNAKPVIPSDPKDKKVKDMTVLNEEAILKEIARMGRDIISRIEVPNKQEGTSDSETSESESGEGESSEGSDSGSE